MDMISPFSTNLHFESENIMSLIWTYNGKTKQLCASNDKYFQIATTNQTFITITSVIQNAYLSLKFEVFNNSSM